MYTQYEQLGMRSLFAERVPYLLKADKEQNLNLISQQSSERFKENLPHFLLSPSSGWLCIKKGKVRMLLPQRLSSWPAT